MFASVQGLVLTVIWLVVLVAKGFAFIDCVRRPASAFPAVSRQTKALWLVVTGLALLTGLLPNLTTELLGLAGTVAALVYLFDVRPRVQEITGRR